MTRLNITAATVRAAMPRGSLLPPNTFETLRCSARRVAGTLNAAVSDRDWRSQPGHFISVPKRFGGRREVAVLTLADRVRYEAMVRALEPYIDAALGDRSVLFGPRGHDRTLRWLSFERAILRQGSAFVVSADVADFYGSIDRARALDALTRGGAPEALVELLGGLLETVMDGHQGLPPTYSASDALATRCLAELDSAMARRGWDYVRCQDDIRVAVRDHAAAEEALQVLESELQRAGLRLRADKTQVASTADYAARLFLGSRWEVYLWSRIAPLVEGGWLDRHLRTPGEHLTGLLRSRRDRVIRARSTLESALATDAGSLTMEDRRAVVAALAIVRKAKDPVVVPFAPGLIKLFPAEVSTVAQILCALPVSRPDAAGACALNLLLNGGQGQGLTTAWLYWMLGRRPTALPRAVVEHAIDAAQSPAAEWVCRMQAAWLLSRRGLLEGAILDELRTTAPPSLAGALPPAHATHPHR